jgi:hypothetical protein
MRRAAPYPPLKPAAGEKFGEKTVIFSNSYYNNRKLFFH